MMVMRAMFAVTLAAALQPRPAGDVACVGRHRKSSPLGRCTERFCVGAGRQSHFGVFSPLVHAL